MKRFLVTIAALSFVAAIATGGLFDSTLDRSETPAPVAPVETFKSPGGGTHNPVDSTFGPLHAPTLRMQFDDPVPNHNMGIASDGQYYYTVCGGQSANGRLAKYDLQGNPVGTTPCPLDFRSIVYNNADGLFYVSVYTGDVYRITDVSTGTYVMMYDNLLQNSQASMGISWDGQYIYDNHNGTVRVINLSTGTIVNTMTGFSCGSGSSSGGDVVVADPDYLYTVNTSAMTIYVYDHSGTPVTSYPYSQGNYGFSMSFIIGDIWMARDGNYGTGTWYAHNVRDFILSSLNLTLTPHNPPLVIPAGGGNFVFDASIVNTTNAAVNFDAWTEVVLPNGAVYGPLIERLGLSIPGSATIMRQITQVVPGGAPAGNYEYVGKVRTLPDCTVVSSSFPFTKLAGEDAPTHNQGWSCYGWDDEKSQIENHKSQITNLAASPNPFNPETALSYQLQAASDVTLAIYDIAGRKIAVLAEGYYPAGTHQAVWDASSMPSGVYFARLQTDGMVQTQKLLLVK